MHCASMCTASSKYIVVNGGGAWTCPRYRECSAYCESVAHLQCCRGERERERKRGRESGRSPTYIGAQLALNMRRSRKRARARVIRAEFSRGRTRNLRLIYQTAFLSPPPAPLSLAARARAGMHFARALGMQRRTFDASQLFQRKLRSLGHFSLSALPLLFVELKKFHVSVCVY